LFLDVDEKSAREDGLFVAGYYPCFFEYKIHLCVITGKIDAIYYERIEIHKQNFEVRYQGKSSNYSKKELKEYFDLIHYSKVPPDWTIVKLK